MGLSDRSIILTEVNRPFISHASGPYVTDSNGKRYVDFINGQVILGYRHPIVTEAISKQLWSGHGYDQTHPVEIELAEMICEHIPYIEQVQFCAVYPMKIGAELFTYKPLEDTNLLHATDRKVLADETETAFRVPKYAVCNYWGQKPEATILGSALGNGMPIVVMGGKRGSLEVGNQKADLLSIVSAKATFQELLKRNMSDLKYYGKRFEGNVNKCLAELKLHLSGYGPVAYLSGEMSMKKILQINLQNAGYLIGNKWFYTFAHLEGQIEEAFLNVLSDVCHQIKAEGLKYGT